MNVDQWISVETGIMPEEEEDVLLLIREKEFCGRSCEDYELWYLRLVGWRHAGEWILLVNPGMGKRISDLNEEAARDKANGYPSSEYEVVGWAQMPELPGRCEHEKSSNINVTVPILRA